MPFADVHTFGHHHRRDGVLEDELLLVIGLQHDGVFVERSDAACQLYPTEQVNRDRRFVLACCVEEGILDVLRRLIHLPISPLSKNRHAPSRAKLSHQAQTAWITIRPTPPLFNLRTANSALLQSG